MLKGAMAEDIPLFAPLFFAKERLTWFLIGSLATIAWRLQTACFEELVLANSCFYGADGFHTSSSRAADCIKMP